MLLEAHRLTAAAFARAIGVSHVTVGNWLRGSLPNSTHLGSISRHFHLPVESLLSLDETERYQPELETRVLIAEHNLRVLRTKLRELIDSDFFKPVSPSVEIASGNAIESEVSELGQILARETRLHDSLPTEGQNKKQSMVDSNRFHEQQQSSVAIYSSWAELREEIQMLTRARGARAALAREFGATRQAVDAWLTGVSAPTADNTLRLLKWVNSAKAEIKTKSAGSVTSTPDAADPKKEPSNEPKSSP